MNTSYENIFYDQSHQDRQQHELNTTKRSAGSHAIAQGLLAIACVMGGHYFWDKQNPIAFLICWAGLRGSVEQHTKALSQYLSARRKLKTIEKNWLNIQR